VKTLSSIQLLFLGTVLSLTSGAVAQLPVTASSGTVVASGLNDPRGLPFDQDGALYFAEAGTGGTTSPVGTCTQGLPQIGPYKGGPSARISKLAANGKHWSFPTFLEDFRIPAMARWSGSMPMA
jgi:hypothetical protein